MTTFKTFIKPTQLTILALSLGSTLAVAGEMNPDRFISSVRPGDKMVFFNKANSDAGATVAEKKAIEFSAVNNGSSVFGATFVKGKKFDDHTFFNADNTEQILNQYAACSLLIESEPQVRISGVGANDIPKIRIMNSIKNQKLTLVLKSEAIFSRSLDSSERSTVTFDIVPVKLAEGTLRQISCQFNKPLHIVKSEFKVSSMMEAFKEHASFLTPDQAQMNITQEISGEKSAKHLAIAKNQ